MVGWHDGLKSDIQKSFIQSPVMDLLFQTSLPFSRLFAKNVLNCSEPSATRNTTKDENLFHLFSTETHLSLSQFSVQCWT